MPRDAIDNKINIKNNTFFNISKISITSSFSMEEIPGQGWKINASTTDLHRDTSMNQGNVMTEYEEKFSAMGNPIYKLIASR